MGSEILVTFSFLDTTQQLTGDSLRYVGPVIWSKLSKDVKNTESLLSLLKSKMKSKCCQITKAMDSIHAQSVY